MIKWLENGTIPFPFANAKLTLLFGINKKNSDYFCGLYYFNYIVSVLLLVTYIVYNSTLNVTFIP